MRARLLLAAAIVLAASACAPEPRVFSDDLVEVPDVVGAPVAEATEDLTDLGFIVRVQPEGTDTFTDCPNGTVIEQDPTPDEEVLKASTLTLIARGC